MTKNWKRTHALVIDQNLKYFWINTEKDEKQTSRQTFDYIGVFIICLIDLPTEVYLELKYEHLQYQSKGRFDMA